MTETAPEPERKRRKVISGDRFLRKKCPASALGFLANLDLPDVETMNQRKPRKAKKKDFDSDEEEMTYESRPRTQDAWIDAERKRSKLPTKAEDGSEVVTTNAGTGPRPFAEEGAAMSKKQARRIAEKDAEEFQRLDKRKREKEERYEKEKQERLAAKKEKLTEVQVMLKKAVTFEDCRKLLAVVSQRIAANPKKEMDLFDVFFAYENGDSKLARLALLSMVMVVKDCIPGYRISEKTDRNQGVKLSKNVEDLQKFETKFLGLYKRLVSTLERWRTWDPLLAFSSLAELLKVATHFNLRERLVNSVCRGATSGEPKVAERCVETLREVIRCDRSLATTKEVVLAMGRIVKAYVAAKGRGGGKMSGLTGAMLDLLMDMRLNQAERVALHDRDIQDIEDDEFRKEMEAASINESSRELKKLEAEIMTEIFVLYLRILRAAHLQSNDVLASTLTGLGKRAHEVNLELMMELLDETRGQVKHTDTTIACLAVRCCFDLLAGPSASLTVDVSWLSEALVETCTLSLPFLSRGVGKAQHRMAEIVLSAVNAFLQCKQLHGDKNASQIETAKLLHALVSVALNADMHVALSAIRVAQQLLMKFPRLKIIMDPEGMLFGTSGSLKDTTLSLHWHNESLKHHLSPIAQAGYKALTAVTSKQLDKTASEDFAKVVKQPADWLQREQPSESAESAWPWDFLAPPPFSAVPIKPSLAPFLAEKDL